MRNTNSLSSISFEIRRELLNGINCCKWLKLIIISISFSCFFSVNAQISVGRTDNVNVSLSAVDDCNSVYEMSLNITNQYWFGFQLTENGETISLSNYVYEGEASSHKGTTNNYVLETKSEYSGPTTYYINTRGGYPYTISSSKPTLDNYVSISGSKKYNEGESVNLTASVCPAGSYTYKWYENDVEIVGQITSELSNYQPTVSNATYKVEALDGGSVVVSNSVKVTTYGSGKRFSVKNWYGVNVGNTIVKEIAGYCNSVYMINLYPSANEPQFEILEGETSLSADDLSVKGISLTATASGDATGWRYSDGSQDQPIVLYLDARKSPYELSTTFDESTMIVATIEQIKGSSQIKRGDVVSFEASVCPANMSSSVSYQWYKSENGGSSWEEISGETNAKLEDQQPTADATIYRVKETSGSLSSYSNEIEITFLPASVNVDIVTETGLYRQVTPIEYEVSSNSYVTMTAIPIEIQDVTYTLEEKSFDEDTYNSSTLTGEDGVWKFLPKESKVYKITATGLNPITGETEKYSKEVVLRIVYTCDAKSSHPDTLWFDDFGYFKSETSFVIKDADDNVKTFDNSLTDVEGNIFDIKNYWAADVFGSVKEHKFALKDPRVTESCENNNEAFSCWCPDKTGYRVEDGFYAILSNPNNSNCGNSDYWSGSDHTGTDNGGMLFVNCSANSKNEVIYERKITISNDCKDVQLLFSAFINNAAMTANAQSVNVRLDILDEDGNTIHSASSGDIQGRTADSHNWSNLTFKFKATGKSYTFRLTNNNDGGSNNPGNDILIDDISISICYPSIELISDNGSKSVTSIVTCERDTVVNLIAYNELGLEEYFENPRYIFQYKKEGGDWINLSEIGTSNKATIILSRDDERFFGKTRFRAVAGSSDEVVEKILSGESLEISCEQMFAIDSMFYVMFDYSGPMGSNFDTTECVGNEITITGESSSKPEWEWIDANTGETLVPRSSDENNKKYTFTVSEDLRKFYFVAYESMGCPDTQTIVVRKKEYVEFTTPENDKFITCGYDNPVELKDILPSGSSYKWTINGRLDESQTSGSYKIADTESLNGKIVVTGSAEGYCDVTKEFSYEIFQKFDLDLTLDAVDNKLCFASSDDVKLTATFDPSTARPSTYFWYQDGNLLESTQNNSYKVTISENGKYDFKVVAIDDVCYKSESEGPSDSELLLASKTVGLNFTPHDTIVCEGQPIKFNINVENALDQVDITWTGSDIENGSVVHKSVNFTDELTINPVKETKFTDKHVVIISVPDDVCPGGKVEKEISYTINNKIDLSIVADDTYCLDGKDNITLSAEVVSGVPTQYSWYKEGAFVSASETNTITLPIENGKNEYQVIAGDGICNNKTSDAKSIQARKSINLVIDPVDTIFCEGTNVKFNAVVNNALDSANVAVTWTGDDIEGSVETKGYISHLLKTPLKSNTEIEKRQITISVADDVCRNGESVELSTSYSIHNNMNVEIKGDDVYCLSNGDELTIEAEVLTGNPTSYEWFLDGAFVGSTEKNSVRIPVNDGANVYRVIASDGICSAFTSSDKTIQARKPVIIQITPAKSEICEGSEIKLVATVENALDPENTIVTWTGSDIAESKETKGIETYLTLSPLKTNDFTESRNVTITTPDDVCGNGGLASALAVYNVHNNIEVVIDAERTDDLFCLNSNETNKIKLTPNVKKGEPIHFDWYLDDELIGSSKDLNPLMLDIKVGSNSYKVVSSDSVCNPNTSVVKAIEARFPMTMTITADKDKICEDGSITFTADVTNSLDDKTVIEWSGDDIEEGAKSIGNSSSYVVKTTKSNVKKVSAITYAQATDNVCQTVVKSSVKYDVYMKIDLSLFSDADADNGKRCMTKGTTSENLILTVQVNKGDPIGFTWSDGYDGPLDITNSRVVQLVEGVNTYSVYATDGVCNIESAGTQAKASNSVEVREPVSLILTSNDDHICVNNGTTAQVVVNNSHAGSSTNIEWNATETSAKKLNNVSNGVYDNKYFFGVGNNEIIVSGYDANSDVCPATVVSTNVYVQDSLRLVIKEESNSLCQRSDTTQYVGLNVYVKTGWPNSIVWSTEKETNVDAAGHSRIEVAPDKNTIYWAYGTDNVCRNSSKVYTNEIRVSNRFDINLVATPKDVQMGEYVTLVAETTNDEYTSFLWFLNDQDFEQTLDNKITYQIEDAGNYMFSVVGLSENCPGRLSDSRKIVSADFTEIPNIITPYNGNIKNNIFMYGYKVEIYNRYQQLVFEGDNGWDGTYRGKIAQPGTYYYRIFMKDGRVFKGSIEVAKF